MTQPEKSQPKISVVMNCAYGVEFLREAIDSVFAQTWPSWEIVFVDNCSTDGSAELARSYEPFGKLRYVKTPERIPLYAARNFGLDYADGDYIAFLDVDDMWEPETLEKLAQAMTPDVSLVYGGYRYVDKVGRALPKQVQGHAAGDIMTALMIRAFVAISCILVRREMFELERFDPTYDMKGDFDLWMRLCTHGALWAVVKGHLAKIRVHGNNLSSVQAKKWIVEERRFYRSFIRRFGLRYPSVLLFIAKYEFAHLIGHKKI